MSRHHYKVWFQGEILPGSILADVKSRLATMFKLPLERIDAMFSGQPIVIQEGADKQTALKYKAAFEQAGAICHIESVSKKISEGLVNVVFYGEIAADQPKDEVKRRVASLFRLTPQQLKQAFSGQPFLVKDRIDPQSARKYKAAFEQAGTICHIEPVAPQQAEKPSRKTVVLSSQSERKRKTPQKKPLQQTSQAMMTCPKCGFQQKTAPACRRCGIIIEKFFSQQQVRQSSGERSKPEISPASEQGQELIRQIIQQYIPKIKDNRIYFAPNIPEKKLHSAIKAYATRVKPDDVLVLIDNSVLGNGKKGIILTVESLYTIAKKGVIKQPSEFGLSGIRSFTCQNVQDFEDLVGLGGELFMNNTSLTIMKEPTTQALFQFSSMVDKMCQVSRNPSQAVMAITPEKKIDNRDVKDKIVTVVKQYHAKIKSTQIFFKISGIPPKKLSNALKTFAPTVKSGAVLLLVDTTTFGSGKEGLLLTSSEIHYKVIGQRPMSFAIDAIETVTFVPGVLNDDVLLNDIRVLLLPVTERASTSYLVEMLKEVCALFTLKMSSGSAESLKQLKELYDTGILTEEEYQEKRKKYIDRL